MPIERKEIVKRYLILCEGRDAEKDYEKACREVSGSLRKCGLVSPERCSTWVNDNTGLKVGFILFPMNKKAGTLEELCVKILSEKNNSNILPYIETFLKTMETSLGRNYRRKHKNRLHVYLSCTDKYVAMPIGTASSAGAFDWSSDELEPLKNFLTEGFIGTDLLKGIAKEWKG